MITKRGKFIATMTICLWNYEITKILYRIILRLETGVQFKATYRAISLAVCRLPWEREREREREIIDKYAPKWKYEITELTPHS